MRNLKFADEVFFRFLRNFISGSTVQKINNSLLRGNEWNLEINLNGKICRKKLFSISFSHRFLKLASSWNSNGIKILKKKQKKRVKMWKCENREIIWKGKQHLWNLHLLTVNLLKETIRLFFSCISIYQINNLQLTELL